MSLSPDSDLRLILDIGTHKVLGLVVRPTDEGVEVLASHRLQHTGRAMRDGQIHDVPAVAQTLRAIKKHLEEVQGVTFRQAYIAAAGRALKTLSGRSEQSHAHHVLITPELQRSLEWEAVAQAQSGLQQSLEAEERALGYYCIAHSVIQYTLEGEPIGVLVGQRGRTIGVEVLATFLPAAVVDSLESALREAGLEMRGLTLEPIAALEAVIPPTMRHLKLALVDVGAGTSDIALTGHNTVQAFAMVPQAGDAITEAVSNAFLLDFPVAEEVKRRVASGQAVQVLNVLGEPVEVTPEALGEVIREPVESLAARVAQEIVHWSAGTPPAAILLVGGGSQTPGLAQALARCLELPPQRVAVRDRNAVRGVTGAEELTGPDVVTALGIALRAVRRDEMPPLRVRVNGQPVCLFLPDRCTVREAVRVAGLPPQRILGRIGSSVTVTVNGRLVIIPGTKGQPAPIWVNQQPASLDTVLADLDEVRIDEPVDGQPPEVTVGDLMRRWQEEQAQHQGTQPPRICLDGQWMELPLWVIRNGRPARPEDPVNDRDVLEIRFPETAAELMEALGRQMPSAIHCWVNGTPVSLPAGGSLLRNGEPALPDDMVEDGDDWQWVPGHVRVRDALATLDIPAERTVQITVNDQPVTLHVPVEIVRNGQPAAWDEPVAPGDRLQVKLDGQLTLYQVLPYAGVQLPGEGSVDHNKRLVLRVGEQEAGFTTPIKDGDRVIIRYE